MKSMDIRSAFQSLGTRKRKAAETDENAVKIIKLSKDNNSDESLIDSKTVSNDARLCESSCNVNVTNGEQSVKVISVIDIVGDSQSSIEALESKNVNDFDKENLPNSHGSSSNLEVLERESASQSVLSTSRNDNKQEHSHPSEDQVVCDGLEATKEKNVTITELFGKIVTSQSCGTQKRKRQSSDSSEKLPTVKDSTANKALVHEAILPPSKPVDQADKGSSKDIESDHSSCEISDVSGCLPESSDPVFRTEKNDCDSSKLDSSIDCQSEDDNQTETDLNSSLGAASNDKALDNTESSQRDSSVNKTPITGEQSSSGVIKTENKTPVRRKKLMSVAEAKLKEQKRLEKEKLAEEKRQLKEEKELEKQRILKEKQIRKEREEIERKERERLKQEKKEQEEQRRQKEKEERAKAKQLLVESKAEEKKKKDEEKTKAAEEKRKKEDEKKQADEDKKKLQLEKERKNKEAFANFFKKSGFLISQSQPQVTESAAKSAPENEVVFKPFQVTDGMALAPVIPSAAQKRFNKALLDAEMQNQTCEFLYIDLLKSEEYISISYEKKNPNVDNESEVVIIKDSQEAGLRLKGKLLQFCDNIRPAYWGTWRKFSQKVRPRNPFGQDVILDYEVDSDEEWDEGGPGESLTGTEDEESEDDYEVDNEFFVPHGYLSAEEEGDDENSAPANPDELKTRLKLKEKEFLLERKKKTVELKPIIFGCFFQADHDNNTSAAEKFLLPYSAELLTTKDILTALKLGENTEAKVTSNHISTAGTNRFPVPNEAMPFLIRLLHGNINNVNLLSKEFKVFWAEHCQKNLDCETPGSTTPMEIDNPEGSEPLEKKKNATKSVSATISKRQLFKTIRSIAKYGKHELKDKSRMCWWVENSTLEKYELLDAPIPNEWNYVTKECTEIIQEKPEKPPVKNTIKTFLN